MIYVLILITSFIKGAGVATHEFNSREACEKAAMAVKADEGFVLGVKAYCVEKGEAK